MNDELSQVSNNMKDSLSTLVLGDSHVRAYGMNPNFTPIFLGSGKVANFTDWSRVDALLKRCDLVNEASSPKTILICLGEPDTRYAFGLGWQPWNSIHPRDEDNFSFIEKCSIRYAYFVQMLEDRFKWDVRVQNIVLTQDISQCRYIDYYNELLSKKLGTKLITFNDKIRSNNGSINTNYSWDRIHANCEIVPFVESALGQLIVDRQMVSNETMKRYFNKNKRFSSFEILENPRPSFIQRVTNFLNRGR